MNKIIKVYLNIFELDKLLKENLELKKQLDMKSNKK